VQVCREIFCTLKGRVVTMKKKINRRDFLNGTLVAAAGFVGHSMVPSLPFAAVSGAKSLPPPTGAFNPYMNCHQLMGGGGWDLPPATGELLDCVIIGGGISGLAAAWKLRRMGARNILVLEKNDRTGGQCRRITTDDGRSASQGSAYASIPYTRLLTELYTDLEIVTGTLEDGRPLVDPAYLLAKPWARHWIGHQWYDDPWESEAALGGLPYSDGIIEDFRTLREIVEWWWDFEGSDEKPALALPISDASRDDDVLWLDGQTLAEYLQWEGLDPEVAEFFRPLFRSVFSLAPDEVSAYAGVGFLTDEVLTGDEYDSVICRPGGNAVIAEGIARLVGEERILTNRFVLRAVNSGDEVHVSYLENGQPTTIRARTAIYASPRMMAPYILPDLPSPQERFNYGAYIVANIHVSETPPDLAYANEVHGDFFFTDFTVADWAGLEDPVNAPLSRPNILTIYAPQTQWDARSRLLSTPLEEFEAQIFEDLERVLPGVGDIATAFDLFRWGHPMVQARPGFVFSAGRENAARPIGKIYSAGHETEGIPYIDTAITAGARAAVEAAADLSLRGPRNSSGRAG